MYIGKIDISGFRNIKETVTVTFNKGINVLIGENSVGKTSIIDALRLVLSEDDYGKITISDSDFHIPFDNPNAPLTDIHFKAHLKNLNEKEKIAYLPWLIDNNEMSLSLSIDKNTNSRGRFNKKYWGGYSSSSAFEWELLNSIDCVYLPPLRDAQAKLKEGRGSRLARLLKILSKDELEAARKNNTLHELERKYKVFNEDLAKDDKSVINRANELIKKNLTQALGDVFSQDTNIQFSEVNFNRIVENLRLLFYPNIKDKAPNDNFRSLDQNSLGYNNLLYIATILAELTNVEEKSEGFKVLLIEEPEAHLHPQLQTKLFDYLRKASKDKNIQIIVTSHSPTIASSVSINDVIHLASIEGKSISTTISQLNISKNSRLFIDRWLDVTKSSMLFAKGIILVEGIAESILFGEIARIVIGNYNNNNPDDILPLSLEEAGISVVNMNGIYFKHFMQLYYNKNSTIKVIPTRCAGVTDKDPGKNKFPIMTDDYPSKNPAFSLIEEYSTSQNCRLFMNSLKTFEYDIAMQGNNIWFLLKVLSKSWHTDASHEGTVLHSVNELLTEKWCDATQLRKSEVSKQILGWIDNSNIGKGYFAQRAAQLLQNYREKKDKVYNLTIPQYISNSIIWACGGDLDE